MATWSLIAQLQSGATLAVANDNHVWWNGTNFGDNIIVGQYQDSTHIADSDDGQLDGSDPVHNTKYVDAAHVSIDGAASSAFPIPQASCGLKFTFSDPSSVEVSGVKLYAYDGIEDINQIDNIDIQVAEGGVSTSWTNCNGLGNALAFQDQASATSHDFYVATSLSPQTSGLKSGKLKLVLSYV